jgi:hypothetical protein
MCGIAERDNGRSCDKYLFHNNLFPEKIEIEKKSKYAPETPDRIPDNLRENIQIMCINPATYRGKPVVTAILRVLPPPPAYFLSSPKAYSLRTFSALTA